MVRGDEHQLKRLHLLCKVYIFCLNKRKNIKIKIEHRRWILKYCIVVLLPLLVFLLLASPLCCIYTVEGKAGDIGM